MFKYSLNEHQKANKVVVFLDIIQLPTFIENKQGIALSIGPN
jgi:hypothetical protein